MQELSYATADKSEWGDGPWKDEPDKRQFIDQETGLPCLIVRNSMGALCGYVGVSRGHPLYEKSYDNCYHLDVHGGVTFAGSCQPDTKEAWEKWRKNMLSRRDEVARYPQGDMAEFWAKDGHLVDDYEAWKANHECDSICHKVEPGEDDKVWWLGFDCAHGCDISPKMLAFERKTMPDLYDPSDYATYKTVDYVKDQCQMLAKQLKELEPDGN